MTTPPPGRTDLRPYPVEIAPPDLSAHRSGNTGVDYFTTLAAPAPGPHVMVTALMHGNELCGAVVLDRLLRDGFLPDRGRLTLGFCNVAAYLQFDPDRPTLSRYVDEDMNRVWEEAVLDNDRTSVELERAREIRPLLDDVDMLLDIHSMQHPTEPLMLAGPLDKGRRLAESVGVPATIVLDAGHAAGRRMRDYGRFGDPEASGAALLVECGQHWAATSVTVARETLVRFLVAAGVAGQDRFDPVACPEQTVIEVTHPVTVKTNRFRFTRSYLGMEIIEKAGTVIGHDGDDEVRTPHDRCVLIMPSRRLGRGQTAVRLGRIIG